MAEPVATGVQKYLTMIAAYDNEFKKWESRTTKIIKRYRDDTRSASGNETAKFNILWSNVQTLIPAVYARLPTADAKRRFGDNDKVGRVAAQLIERALDFEIEHYPDFRNAMNYAVQDRFLGGRGVAWVRYEPHVRQQDVPEDGLQITDVVENEEDKYEDVGSSPVRSSYRAPGGILGGSPGALPGAAISQPEAAPAALANGAEGPMPGAEDPTAGQQEVAEEIDYECAPSDYVHWKDFGHSTARTWDEVTAVWRWVYMTKEALVERFGEKKAKSIPLDSGPEPLAGYSGTKQRDNTRAKICELWDKEADKVYWISKSSPDFVDEREDPLDLEGFFPCSKPLYSTLTSDSLVPVPDFVLYQDQAQELDILSDRIDGLIKALRARRVYDASQPALQRLLTEGDNNSLIPVDKWMAFGEKGGLKGSIDLLPLDTLSNALMQCYRAREDIKSQIYEITGISDIIRGQTNANETATAQQIKGQYAGLRLRSLQDEVALFATEIIRLKAQIICTRFQPQTILDYAAAEQMTDEDKALIPQALELLQSDPLSSFRIEVNADSLVQIDENQAKQDRISFLQAFGGFLTQALPIGQQSPEMIPMMIGLLKYGVTAFKGAQGIEGLIDTALDQIKNAQQQAAGQPPKPDPEMMKAQAAQQAEQMKAQMSAQTEQMRVQADAQAMQAKAQFDAQMQQAKLQSDMQIEQMKANLSAQQEGQRMQHEMAMKSQEVAAAEQFDRWKAELEAATKVLVARIGANPGMDIPAIEATNAASDKITAELGNHVRETMNKIADMQNQTMNHISGVMQVLAAPKRIVRGADGRAAGIEVLQ